MDATPEKIKAYLERALTGRGQASAVELPLNELDDFVVVQRLTMLGWLDDCSLAENFTVELLDKRELANEWIACPDFIVRRTNAASGDA